MLLEKLGASLSEHGPVKFAVILSNPIEVNSAIKRSLSDFGILKQFLVYEDLCERITLPIWTNSREFNVLNSKVYITGSHSNNGPSYYFCNLDDCWWTLVLKITRHIGGTAAFIRSSAINAKRAEYVQSFTLIESGEISRIVRVSYDEGWEFYDAGPALPFEDIARYETVAVQNRLSRSYLLHLIDSLTVTPLKLIPPFIVYEWNRI